MEKGVQGVLASGGSHRLALFRCIVRFVFLRLPFQSLFHSLVGTELNTLCGLAN